MEWSSEQLSAIQAFNDWVSGRGTNGSEQVFRIFGFAGTGKTTLAKRLSDESNGKTLFGAFTGKAALVLQEKGCHNAKTIHQLIYRPKEKSEALLHELQEELVGCTDALRQNELQIRIQMESENLKRPSFSLNTDSDLNSASLVIIDEVSMVGTRMGEDLLSFGCPILVLGDTAQLPPVGDGGYFTNSEPDVMLREIHRQAEGSPIIKLATKVREGQMLEYGEVTSDSHPSSHVVPKGRLSIEDLSKFDQILVGRNKTRKLINRQIRKNIQRRESHLPEEGEKLVCLRNNHQLGLWNGSMWEVKRCNVLNEDALGVTIKDVCSEAEVDTIVHRHHFEDREHELTHYEKRERDEFDFGYALTVHKSQGSQWKNVVVVDESSCFRNDSSKWLYTGITRASESVTVIR